MTRGSTTPRQKAERCFALARSTAFAGERDAAIARGVTIAEQAGLALDSFDIPGRVRKQSSSHKLHQIHIDLAGRKDDFAEAIRQFQDHMRRLADDETFYAAFRGQVRR